jgi:hypothetical protein
MHIFLDKEYENCKIYLLLIYILMLFYLATGGER